MIRFFFRWVGVLMASSTVLLIGYDIVNRLSALIIFTIGGILMFLLEVKKEKYLGIRFFPNVCCLI